MDDFETRIPNWALTVLLDIGSEIGFDPTASSESEDYFITVLQEFNGEQWELETWLRSKFAEAFKSVGALPEWIQNPSWQFSKKGPMIFVGQINVPPGLFHDEASFYLFFDQETGTTKTIIQVS